MIVLMTEEVMKIRPRSTFGESLLQAGIRKSDLARAANLSAQTIQRLAKPENYKNNDKGNVSAITARRVALAFSSLASGTADQAYDALFEEVEDDDDDA